MSAEFFLHKSSPTYIHPENAADVINIGHFMAQNLRQAPIPPPPKHTFEISEGESVEIEKIVAAEKKEGQIYYKVKWVKYTWEAEESIQHLPHLIDGYWREHFYQNINQAAIDTSGINLVANEADFRNKVAVVNAAADTGKQADALAEKLTSPIAPHNLNVSSAAQVAGHENVILEFTLQQQQQQQQQQDPKAENFQARLNLSQEKKPRRAQPLERKYVCQICNKAFDRNTSLTRHLLTHTREKPFKCQLCDKAFSQNAHLKRHILIHIGQKSYQCNKCGKMFIEKGGLARHEATHRKEKPFICNQCGKAFVLNEYLQRHLFLHTGQKPYQCNECGRLFADGSSWRAHKLTHNKEKKYKCPICQKMLKCKRNFKKHVEAHADENDCKHLCDVCHMRFPNKRSLKDHYKNIDKVHKCSVCKFFMESRSVYESHMLTHDPNSETYNPNPKIYEDNEEDEQEENTAALKAVSAESKGVDEEEENGKSDGESADQNDESDETLNEILDQSQSSQDISDTSQNIVSSESDIPSSFTTLILQPENIEKHTACSDNPVDEPGDDEIDEDIDMTAETVEVEQTQQQSIHQNIVNQNIQVPTPTLNIAGLNSSVTRADNTAVVNSSLGSVLAAISMQSAMNDPGIVMKETPINSTVVTPHIVTGQVTPSNAIALTGNGVPVIMQGIVPPTVVGPTSSDLRTVIGTNFNTSSLPVTHTPVVSSVGVNLPQNMSHKQQDTNIDTGRQATEAEVEKTIILITQSTDDETNEIN